MKTTFGTIRAEKGTHDLRPFKIVDMMGLDVETGDGRKMLSAGGGVRTLPRTVFGGFNEGLSHVDNVVIGRLDAVEFDPENHTTTGWGWLLDDENGRKAAVYAESQALRHNSVHLAEIAIEIEWKSDDPADPDFFEYTLTFTKWKIASTTMLAIPAFAEATIELTASALLAVGDSEEVLEITHGTDPAETTYDVIFPTPTREEITAATTTAPRPQWDWFFRAEGAEPTPITIGEPDENGFVPVYGNLARWNTCHEGIDARCVVAPYDPTDYASFNASSVLTTRGTVNTGPIFLLHGHPDRPLGERDAWQAYGGVENAWADVRVTHGVHGPWICGYVREGTDDKAVVTARASRISGHWARDGRLRAIVSVNTPAFDVPASRVFTDEEGHVLEMVASFVPDCRRPKDPVSWESFVAAVMSAMPANEAERLQQALDAADSDEGTTVAVDPVEVSRRLALLAVEADEDSDRDLVS